MAASTVHDTTPLLKRLFFKGKSPGHIGVLWNSVAYHCVISVVRSASKQ
jgi:hypothetical protein